LGFDCEDTPPWVSYERCCAFGVDLTYLGKEEAFIAFEISKVKDLIQLSKELLEYAHWELIPIA
jgi:hypothetical protein